MSIVERSPGPSSPPSVDADTAWFELALMIEYSSWPGHLGPGPNERELRACISPGWWHACPAHTPIALWLSTQILPSLAHARSRAEVFAALSALGSA